MLRKKILALLFTATIPLSITACSSTLPNQDALGVSGEQSEFVQEDAADTITSGIKVGFIFLHDETSTYDLNFINAAINICKETGTAYVLKTGVPEGKDCYATACALADEGCDIIFADSFGHEDYMLKAAKEYPQVQFCHATGTKAHTAKQPNYHNAFATIYEGRYLAGIAAGTKLNELIDAGKFSAKEAKIGYVGAFTYAEVISGYTAFYLGAKSICPSVTMEVTFTGSWYDEKAEAAGAKKLIKNGCVLISQHADSLGAPATCEAAGIPNVCYNGSTLSACPETFLISSKIDWTPYFSYLIDCVQNNKEIATDWTGNLSTGSVVLTSLGHSAAKGTAAAIEQAKADLENGTLNVFDTDSFTVNHKKLTSYRADVNTDEAFKPDTEVIHDGVFMESAEDCRSAPYFDIQIDGIKLLDTAF